MFFFYGFKRLKLIFQLPSSSTESTNPTVKMLSAALEKTGLTYTFHVKVSENSIHGYRTKQSELADMYFNDKKEMQTKLTEMKIKMMKSSRIMPSRAERKAER